MLRTCRRFQDPTPEDIEALSLEGCQQVLDSILHAANLEISVVGDIDQAELDDLALKYLGTVAAREAPKREEAPIMLQQPASPVRLLWHLKDSDERAMALIAGRAPARWGPFEPHPALQHVPEVGQLADLKGQPLIFKTLSQKGFGGDCWVPQSPPREPPSF